MKDYRPSVSEFEKYKAFALTTVSLYKNPLQAYKSDHNFEHAAIVFVLSLAMKGHLELLYEESMHGEMDPHVIDMDAVAIASFLHDSQREGDILESMISLQKHGRLSAQYIKLNAPYLLKLLGRKNNTVEEKDQNKRTIYRAIQACWHHDDAYRPQKGVPELFLVAAADRATLPRIMISYHDGENFAATTGIRSGIYKMIIQTRAENYEESEYFPKGYPHLTKKFLQIGAAFCLLSHEHLMKEKTLPGFQKFSPIRQWEAVKQSAIQLGLLQIE